MYKIVLKKLKTMCDTNARKKKMLFNCLAHFAP